MSSRANKDRHQLTPILLYAADIYYSQTSISRNFAHPHTSTFVEHVPEHKIKTILQNKPIRVVYNKKKGVLAAAQILVHLSPSPKETFLS